MHAASALRHLREMSRGSVEAFGMGGPQLADCGMELLVDTRNHAVMGLVEVLQQYPQLRSNLNLLKRTIRARNPDVVLLVDYPHFNMKLAAEAKALGVPVIYYIAPKVWASRPTRVQELANTIDQMAVIFPFEVNIFKQAGVPTKYVGNPVLENRALSHARELQINPGNYIALLPGSRKSEINHLLKPMLDAARMLYQDHPELQFILPVAETIDSGLISETVSNSEIDIELTDAADFQRLKQCKAALVSSGTATLELALLGIPMVVAYKMNTLSYRVLRRWLTIEHISLVNIIAEKHLVPELLQDEATATQMYEAVLPLLTEGPSRQQQLDGFDVIYQRLARQNVNDSVASMVLSLHNDRVRQRNKKLTASLTG